ncbi:uncharacterized protein LOC142589999 [Dermacentor variabilis]|uniref:uncharacterized protein LOC142589999 n=1 Tax=Dermacentor variabilis TaxID=34621 RepID=UPI003F5B229C
MLWLLSFVYFSMVGFRGYLDCLYHNLNDKGAPRLTFFEGDVQAALPTVSSCLRFFGSCKGWTGTLPATAVTRHGVIRQAQAIMTARARNVVPPGQLGPFAESIARLDSRALLSSLPVVLLPYVDAETYREIHGALDLAHLALEFALMRRLGKAFSVLHPVSIRKSVLEFFPMCYALFTCPFIVLAIIKEFAVIVFPPQGIWCRRVAQLAHVGFLERALLLAGTELVFTLLIFLFTYI